MKVKGTAVKTIPEFITACHKEHYSEWINALPPELRKIFTNIVKASDWYPIEDAIIIPTRIMSKLIYNDNTKGAWECGSYSAKITLNGIYKLYVKMSSPGHIIDRAGRILQAYYDPSELKVVSKGKNHVTLNITKFSKSDAVTDARIAGWMVQALELSGCTNVKLDIPQSISKGNPFTAFVMTWD
ncbi:MAG: hypothetical protein RBR35_02900 [Salinivirgaceae bacterium]|nr:hypothetical protein [Salinivirgaceae bacterium]